MPTAETTKIARQPAIAAIPLAAVRASGVHIKDIATEDPDLEDVFVALTYGDPNAADPTKD